ncbi:ABC transporter ATP-binding protein [Plastoroseomonas hellenica]|nr:ATP-binding cassette domain-containing protein [Plastoroseomonas hellenica]
MSAAGIRIEEVSRTYAARGRQVHALGPISAMLEAGRTTAIVGPSGCGKSTLLRILGGLDRPSGGRVLLGGAPVREGMPGVGVVFQRDLLLDWRNILDNVLLPAQLQKRDLTHAVARAHALLGELGVGDFTDRQPWELSGGMRQRVAIARALLCEPSLLLLDEPFSALDALTRDQMGVLLQRVQGDGRTTAVLITHSIPEAVFLSDRVLVMSARPGLILDDIPIELPRPRTLAMREEPAFAGLTRRIRMHFERTGVLTG